MSTKIGLLMYTTEKGGRKGPPNLGDYRPTIIGVGDYDLVQRSCRVSNGENVALGEWTKAEITFLQEKECPEFFVIYEGRKPVGAGVKIDE